MEKRVIMINGCDRAGKSTLSEMLKEKIRSKGLIPVVFHLTGPEKYYSFDFTQTQKSLVQLVKFEEVYKTIRLLMESDARIVVVLDRTPFEEYVWGRYFERSMSYSNMVNSKECYEKYAEVFERTMLVTLWLSDVGKLAKRIEASPSDRKIYSLHGKTTEENIRDLYGIYDEFYDFVGSFDTGMKTAKFDNSAGMHELEVFANSLIA